MMVVFNVCRENDIMMLIIDIYIVISRIVIDVCSIIWYKVLSLLLMRWIVDCSVLWLLIVVGFC